MDLQEGQVYEGAVSLSGENGEFRRWIVVSPFGKTHIHSIDDPAELRCWPGDVIESGLRDGRVRLVGMEPDHPAVRLQRVKEDAGISDVHLGLSAEGLVRMLDLLRQALAGGADYAPYLAGELLSALSRSGAAGSAAGPLRLEVLAALHRHRPPEAVHISTPP